MKNFFNNAAYNTGADVDQLVFDAVQTPPGADENPAEKKGFSDLPYLKRVAIVWAVFGLMVWLAAIGFFPAAVVAVFMVIPVLAITFKPFPASDDDSYESWTDTGTSAFYCDVPGNLYYPSFSNRNNH